jgi:hypothetical protein
VRPYVRRNKTDRTDAAGLLEPKGRIHDCNRTACPTAIYSVTCRRSPYMNC